MSAAPAPSTHPQTLHIAGDDLSGARQRRSERHQRAAQVKLVTSRRVLTVSGTADERLAALAAVQEGEVARGQLLRGGLTAHEITTRRRNGSLVGVHHGVYAYGHATSTPHGEEIAALLTRGPEAVVSGHSAAALWQIRPKPGGGPSGGGAVHILVPVDRGGGHRDGVRVHRGVLLDELRYVGGVPVVSPAQALLEIASEIEGRALERALDEAFSLGIVNRAEVARMVWLRRNRPGAGRLRELVRARLVGNPSRSDGQERLLALIREAGLADPEMDADIGGGFSVDCLWREARAAAEFDSFRRHSSRSAWARDRRKDSYCREKGIVLLRVTDEDLKGRRLQTAAGLAETVYARRAA